MGVRRQAREAALQALFMCDSLEEWEGDRAAFCLNHFEAADTVKSYADELCNGVITNRTEIDSHISCASEHWSLTRMSRVDRTILRLATFELYWKAEIPLNVSIDEAIEIAKRFGSDSSSVFVNGVLDRVASNLRERIEVERVEDKKEPVAVDLVASSELSSDLSSSESD